MIKQTVDIIICTFNNEAIISLCLQSIKKIEYSFQKCIVVDDCSTDNTTNIIKTYFPWVQVIKKKYNSGPSESRNIGMQNSDAELILFMDSDVYLTKKFLTRLVASMQKMENVVICGGKMVFSNGTIDSAGGGLSKIGVGFDIGHEQILNSHNQGRDVMYTPSAAMLVSRKVIQTLGGFDSTYFYGHEDTDLGWRVNMAGCRVYYEPAAVAYHNKNQTVKNMKKEVYYYGTRNRIRSLLKNHQFKTLLFYLPLYLGYSLLEIIIRPYRKQKIAAWGWNIKNIKDTFKKRKEVQSLRVFNDNELPFSGILKLVNGGLPMAKNRMFCDRCRKRIKSGIFCAKCASFMEKTKDPKPVVEGNYV